MILYSLTSYSPFFFLQYSLQRFSVPSMNSMSGTTNWMVMTIFWQMQSLIALLMTVITSTSQALVPVSCLRCSDVNIAQNPLDKGTFFHEEKRFYFYTSTPIQPRIFTFCSLKIFTSLVISS